MRSAKKKCRQDFDQAESFDFTAYDGITIECVCPKCGSMHKMKLLWSGRGKPKKFCPPCKNFASSMESVDYCCVPANINRGLEKVV